MIAKFKLGDKVQLIDNIAGSMFKIGKIGYVHTVEESTSIHTMLSDKRVYLIRAEDGFFDEGGTWSYACDLKKICSNLNINTKTL